VIVRGCLMGALGVVVGLAAVADAADIGARHLATHKVEQRIRQVVPHTAGVHGRIRSFPFLRAGVNGHVSDVSATIDHLAPYTDVSVDLHGAHVSIGTMVTALRIDVTQISQGAVTFHLTAADLQKAAPSAAPAPARVAVDGLHRVLVVTPQSGAAVVVALPPASVVPCVPTVQPVADGYTLACSFRTVPSAFRTT
jgi:FlaG/FlaF family flagellin (archaellin)